MTPAFTNSSLYFPISASIFSLGIAPASVLSFALIRTMTRIVISPYGLVGLGAGIPDGIDRLIPCSICTSNDVGGNRHVEQFFLGSATTRSKRRSFLVLSAMIRARPRHPCSIDNFFPANTRGVIHVGNLRAERARALAASSSRFLGGAFVSSAFSSFLETAAISSTAVRKTASLAFDGLLKPLTFLTYCNEAARISSSVTGGSKLKRV